MLIWQIILEQDFTADCSLETFAQERKKNYHRFRHTRGENLPHKDTSLAFVSPSAFAFCWHL